MKHVLLGKQWETDGFGYTNLKKHQFRNEDSLVNTDSQLDIKYINI